MHNLTQKYCKKNSSYYIDYAITNISSENGKHRGILIKNLRLFNNVTLKELSKLLSVSENSLRTIESTEKESSYYYYHLYCRHFSVDPYIYLDYSNLSTHTLEDKIIAIKAFLGYKNTEDIDKIIGLYSGAISDCKRGRFPKSKVCALLDEFIYEYKKGYET